MFGHYEYLYDAGLGNSVYVFLVGLLMSQYTVTGFDASAHMSEETKVCRNELHFSFLLLLSLLSLFHLFPALEFLLSRILFT